MSNKYLGGIDLASPFYEMRCKDDQIKKLEAENAELKEHAKEMLDDLNGYADIEEKLIAEIKATNHVVNAARNYAHGKELLQPLLVALKQLDEVSDDS